MKELIGIIKRNGREAVSARKLHAFLGSETDFGRNRRNKMPAGWI
jgi:phage anti-repressor protein